MLIGFFINRMNSTFNPTCRFFFFNFSDGSVLFYPAKPNRHQTRKARQKITTDCMRNRDPSINQPFIPRTHRPPPKEQVKKTTTNQICLQN